MIQAIVPIKSRRSRSRGRARRRQLRDAAARVPPAGHQPVLPGVQAASAAQAAAQGHLHPALPPDDARHRLLGDVVRPLPRARHHGARPDARRGHAGGRRGQPELQGPGPRRRRDRRPRGLLQPHDERSRLLADQARAHLPRPPGQARGGRAAAPLHRDRPRGGRHGRALARPGRAHHHHQRRRRAHAGRAGGVGPRPACLDRPAAARALRARGADPAHEPAARGRARARGAPPPRRPRGHAAGLGDGAQGTRRRLSGHGARLRRPDRAPQGPAPGGLARGRAAHRARDQEPADADPALGPATPAPAVHRPEPGGEAAPRGSHGHHRAGGRGAQAAGGRVLALRADAGAPAPRHGPRPPARGRGGPLPRVPSRARHQGVASRPTCRRSRSTPTRSSGRC